VLRADALGRKRGVGANRAYLAGQADDPVDDGPNGLVRVEDETVSVAEDARLLQVDPARFRHEEVHRRGSPILEYRRTASEHRHRLVGEGRNLDVGW